MAENSTTQKRAVDRSLERHLGFSAQSSEGLDTESITLELNKDRGRKLLPLPEAGSEPATVISITQPLTSRRHFWVKFHILECAS